MALLFFSTSCVYCGNPARCRDHFIPIRYEQPNEPNFELASCERCNGAANTRRFASLKEKILYVRSRTSATLNTVAIAELDKLIDNPPPRQPFTCEVCGCQLSKRQITFCSTRCVNAFHNDKKRRQIRDGKSTNHTNYRNAIDSFLAAKQKDQTP